MTTSIACTHRRPLLLVFVLFGCSTIIISPIDAFSLGNHLSTALPSSRFSRQSRLLATGAPQGGPPSGRPQQQGGPSSGRPQQQGGPPSGRPQQQQQPRRSNYNTNDRRGPSAFQRKYSQAGSATSPRENMEFNKKITQQENAQDLLQLFAGTKGALTLPGGGGRMNSVNMSTGFHRIGRHLSYQNYNNHNNNKSNQNNNNNSNSNNNVDEGNNRPRILSDPRFALFCCATAEALIGGPDIKDAAGQLVQFRPRELSNVAWAIAKIKIAPPKTALPVDVSQNVMEQLAKKSAEVRATVYEVAKQRQGTDDNNNKVTASTWIPALSELTGLIMDAISYRVMTKTKLVYQSQERANLLWALATAQRADSDVFVLIVNSLIQGVIASENTEDRPHRPQEWSNSIWALATASISEPADTLLPFVAELMRSKPGFLAEYKPQELGNTAWGVAKILSNQGSVDLEAPQSKAALEISRLVAQEICERKGQPGFKSQELSNTAWSLATLGFGLGANRGGDNVLNDYMVLPSDDHTGDELLMKAALRSITQMAKQILPKFRSQELNNLAWSMARLNYKDDELLEGIAYQLSNKRFVTLQDVGTTLWSMATLEYQNTQSYRGVAARLTRDRTMQAKPQELSNTLWALATAEVLPEYIDCFDSSLVPPKLRPSPSQVESDPVSMCFVFAAQELMRRPHEFKPQEIKDVLWSFSKVGMRHPALFKSVAEHLVGNGDKEGRGLDDFSPQGIGNMAWAYAKQAQLAEDVIRRYAGKSSMSHNTGRLAVYSATFIDIGEELLRNFFRVIANADIQNHAALSKLKPQDLSNTAWAFSILGMKHESFLAAARTQIISRSSQYVNGNQNVMTRFKGQELTNSLWSLATLDYPFEGILTQVTPYVVQICTDASTGTITVASIANAFKRQELANLAWVCAVAGEYPPELMRILYMGLMGIGENPDCQYVRQIHGDGGIERSAMMSVIYLQIAMDLDGAANGLSLPEGFPDAWDPNGQSSGSTSSSNSENMMEDGLNLSTSRVQRDVSDAFTRVGFDHVMEHVILMDTMVQEFNVQMSAMPIEILSLDLAHVDSKIGIEVDGPAHFVSNIEKSNVPSLGGPQWINGKAEYQFRWNGDVQETNGPTSLKIRLLEQMGWRIVRIPFWEWYAMKGDPKKEDAYCSKLLESL